jgi:hypothetical protein
MIAEYQVYKLRQRLSQQVRGSLYRSFGTKKTSAHTFKYDGKWYKVSIKEVARQRYTKSTDATDSADYMIV